LKESNS
jgi:hypothetical protein